MTKTHGMLLKKITNYRIILNEQQFNTIIDALELLAQAGESEEIKRANELLETLRYQGKEL